MLDGYGIHTLTWDSADERLGDFLVASPADATGRGLELHVRQGGATADLTGASVYFLWRHKMAGGRGCEPMTAIDASLEQFKVYYPAAMQEAEGAVDAQCMVSWDDKSISTRAFTIRVEPVLIGGEFGNGDARRAALGSRYDEVQAEVNRILRGGAVDADALARRVIAGEFGNSDERKRRLGSNYSAVQKRVNEILLGTGSTKTSVDIDSMVRAVIRGEYGNGDERRRRLGSYYSIVQARVNEMLS